LYAIIVLGIGFGFRERLHRILGIALFGIALGKLGLWDIWELETVHRLAVGGSIAVLLLCGGFLYARFTHRIKSLLTDGNSRH